MGVMVEQTFEKFFRGMELSCDVVCEGDTIVEKLENLHTVMQEDRKAADRVTSYALFLRQMVKDESTRVAEGDDIKSLVVQQFFSQILSAMAHKYKNDAPKRHHWLPVAYILAFGSKGKTTKDRANVSGVAFHNKEVISMTVKDVQFAHNSYKDGYYPLPLENFFSRIEASYADNRNSLMKNSIQPMTPIALSAFFIIQSLRNPHPSTGLFPVHDIQSTLTSLILLLNKLDSIHTYIVPSKRKLSFSPYIPTRAKLFQDGSKAYYLPATPRQAIILSDKAIGHDVAQKTAKELHESFIAYARRNNGVIFGVSPADM